MENHHAHEDILEGGGGEAFKTGRGGSQGGGNILQVGGTCGTTFRIGDLGNFGGNGEEGKGHTYGFSEADHGGESVAEGRREMGDAQGGISAVIGGNSFGDGLHRGTTGNGGTVGDAMADF